MLVIWTCDECRYAYSHCWLARVLDGNLAAETTSGRHFGGIACCGVVDCVMRLFKRVLREVECRLSKEVNDDNMNISDAYLGD